MSTVSDAKTLVEIGGGWIGRSVATFLRVVRTPVAFVRSLDLDAPPLRDAALFALFISLVSLALYIPLYRTLGVDADSTSYVVIDTISTFAYWFIQAAIIHAVARALGVRRSFPATLVCVLYLSAYLPLILVVQVPFAHRAHQWRMQDGDLVALMRGDMFGTLIGGSPVVAVSAIATIIFLVCLAWVFVAALAAAYQIGRPRSVGVIVLAGAISLISEAVILNPFQQFMLRAFQRSA